MRQAWDLGPFAASDAMLVPRQISSNKMQRNYMGLKITACMCSWDKFQAKDTNKPKKPIATFEEPGAKNQVLGAKAGYCSCPLKLTPPEGWAKHLSHPSGPTPGHTPTLIPYKKQTHPSPREQVSKETSCLFSLLPAKVRSPIKFCLAKKKKNSIEPYFKKYSFFTALLRILYHFSLKWLQPIQSYAQFLASASFPFSSVQLLSQVRVLVAPWTAACQASLSITNSQSLLKLMSIESVMPSSHLILCHRLLLLPSIFPSFRVFSNESILHIMWPKYWSFRFTISPSNEYSGQNSCRMDWFDLCAVQWTLKSLL